MMELATESFKSKDYHDPLLVAIAIIVFEDTLLTSV
jgi:hypothetical protein